jgi:predicted NACHT family NTPase
VEIGAKPVCHKELATNPLLLTLLCLEFGESSQFPASRSELYGRGLNVLLTKWDGQRRIHRQEVYKKLSTKRKISLLGQLAMYTFDRGDYFFKQAVAEKQIGQYIENLPDASTDPEALLVDSAAVLKSIESQHGLLTARATAIYSFSHLTFHEYFTAKHILEIANPDAQAAMLDQLVEHVTDKRWREVFLLVVEQLEPADDLLQMMQRKIDGILGDDPRLQEYLTWVEAKSESIQSNSPRLVRRFYYALALAFSLDLDLDLAFARNVALDLDLYVAHDGARNLYRDLDLDLDRHLYRARDRSIPNWSISFNRSTIDSPIPKNLKNMNNGGNKMASNGRMISAKS